MRLHRIVRNTLAGLATGVLLGTIGCGRQTQVAERSEASTKPVAGPTVAKSKVPTDKSSRPAVGNNNVITRTATEYYADWNNLDTAGKKYGGKTIELTGEIQWIQRKRITLKAGRENLDYVHCDLAKDAPIEKLGHGQKVKLRGGLKKVPGFDLPLEPHLVDCLLVELGPNPEKPMSAVAFAKEYARKPDEVIRKYEKKGLTVEGTILRVAERELTLKGGLRGIRCAFFENQGRFEIGQRVRVIGQFAANLGLEAANLGPEEGPALHGCLVVPLPDERVSAPKGPPPWAVTPENNPFRKAKVGDYAAYLLTVKSHSSPLANKETETVLMETPFKHSVVEGNANAVTLQVPGERGAFREINVELTKPYDLIGMVAQFGRDAAILESAPSTFENSGSGKETIKIGAKTYECDWFQVKTNNEDDEWLIKMWFCKSVPLTGLVKMEVKPGSENDISWSYHWELMEFGDRKADEARMDAMKRELEKLKGTWKAVSVTFSDGSMMPQDHLAKHKVAFTNDQIVYEGERNHRTGFSIDPSRTPKTITSLRFHLYNPGVPTLIRGIYALDGDTLKICNSGPSKDRPTDFKVNKDTGTEIMVFKKEKS